jgi:hypothetical protein
VTKSAGHRAGEGLPSSRRHYRHVPRPIRRGVLRGCASRLSTASMAFALISGARHSLLPPEGETSNDAAGFALCYGPHRRSPIRAFDAGLRPRPFPGGAASLLPGLLAATRTGLTPASDDELTNTKIHRGLVTVSPPIPLGARKIRVRWDKPPLTKTAEVNDEVPTMQAIGDQEARTLAEIIEKENPGWIVVFGLYSRQFVCFPRFPVPQGTVLVSRRRSGTRTGHASSVLDRLPDESAKQRSGQNITHAPTK